MNNTRKRSTTSLFWMSIRTSPILAIGLAVSAILIGCTHDPASQHRIKQRNQRAAQTIDESQQSERRRPKKLEKTMADISRDQERKKVQFDDTMRTLGDRFW